MSEKMREEFEAWFCGSYSAHKISRRMTLGGDMADEYADPRTDMCWLSWKASRESLVMDFTPCVFPCEYIMVVEASGVKVKL